MALLIRVLCQATQRKSKLKNDREEVLEIATMTEELRSDIKQHLTEMSETINKLRNVMTSDQMVRLFLWGKDPNNAQLLQFLNKQKYQNPVPL